MKSFLRLASLSSLVCTLPLGCSSETSKLPLEDKCDQVGFDRYEFSVLNDQALSFEPDDAGAFPVVEPGEVIVDDDDLTDDYPIYLKGLALYEKLRPKYQSSIDVYEAIPAGTLPEDYTEEQNAANEALNPLREELTTICWNYGGFYRNDRPELGVKPMFLSCKDKYDENGDGVVGWYDLTAAKAGSDDAEMAKCSSLMTDLTTGKPLDQANTHALNFWGPVSTFPQGIPGPEIPADGFTYSGMTIPLEVAAYGSTRDLSDWEGIAFWARQANVGEATSLSDSDALQKPQARKDVSKDAHPEIGESQIGVIIQTIDTAAFGEDPGSRSKFYADSSCTIDGEEAPCFANQKAFDDFPGPLNTDETEPSRKYKWGVPDEHGRPADIPQPFCIDYSPVDAKVGEEAPFRSQCWDGFRTMLEIGREWRFHFVPFSAMRQAGWGQYAPSFRTDQVRSINFLASAFQSTNVLVDEVALYRKKK